MEPNYWNILLVAWHVIVAVALVILFRQTALISMRIGLQGAVKESEPALVAGAPLPESVLALVPELKKDDIRYIVWVSSTCATCHRLVGELTADGVAARLPGEVVFLLTGEDSKADAIYTQLLEFGIVLKDQVASDVVGSLGLRAAPFAVEVESGIISGWSELEGVVDLRRLHDARERSDAAEYVATGKASREA